MAGYPPPYPPPPSGPNPGQDWKYQRRILKEQARAQRDMIRAQRDAYRAQVRSRRPSSIVGPLLVVAIGVVFLLVQLGRLSFYRFGYLFGRFWPLLLVVVGIVLLIEWTVDRNRHHDGNIPYSRPVVGGGVITLLVLIIVAGIGAKGFEDGHRNIFSRGFGMGITPDNIDQFFGDKHESDQSLDQVFPANALLSVTNPRGDVTLSGTSEDNKIHIMVHKQVYTRSDSDAENRATQLTPQIKSESTATSNTFDITMPSLEGGQADLTITLPAAAAATITANHGDVHANAINGPVKVTANHGDVELSAINGLVNTRINNSGSSFSAHSINGPITLEGRGRDVTISEISGPVSIGGDYFGSTHVEHVRGPVRFHSSRTDFQLTNVSGEINISSSDINADGAQGPVSLTTRSRNINLERISGDLSVTNSNGSVDLSSAPPLGNVTVQNRHGSVNITVPEQASFVVQAETSNGNIENDFSLSTKENNNRQNMGGTIGKGGSLIRINTSEGDIGLKKANLSPLPPPPPMPPNTPDSKHLSITGEDGSSVYIGKDGVRIISSADGSKVIIGKDGLNIRAGSDGSSVYRAADGTRLTENADGSKIYVSTSGTHLTQNVDGSVIYVGSNGNHYTRNADGSVTYAGSNGVRISVGADGRQTSVGAGGQTLSDSQVREQLRKAEDEIRKVEQQIDTVRRKRDAERNKPSTK